MIDCIRNPSLRVKFAWWLLGLTLIFWPLSMLTFAKSEPPTMLALSWFAVILAALNILATTDVRREQTNEGDA